MSFAATPSRSSARTCKSICKTDRLRLNKRRGVGDCIPHASSLCLLLTYASGSERLARHRFYGQFHYAVEPEGALFMLEVAIGHEVGRLLSEGYLARLNHSFALL